MATNLDLGPEKRKAAEDDRVGHVLRQLLDLSRSYFARLLRVKDEDKPQIYAQIFESAEFVDLNYWLEVVFSIGIATLGLIINSPAVVIGAMLISPLMGPIIASGLAIELGDFYLGFKAITNTLLSILVSVSLAAIITWALPFHAPTPEILARVQPTILDLGIAVLSGMAGAIVVCRGGAGGGVTALPGVAVAVALMPPLGVVGFGIGAGWDWAILRGGGLLFLTNLVAIILSSFLVFFSIRMDAPKVRLQISEWLEKREKTEHFYEVIERTPLRRLLGGVGTLPQRMLILLIFLVMVAYPLQRSLTRLVGEARVRRVVLDELHKFIPRDSIFREEIEIFSDRLQVRVVALLPKGFPSERRRQLEELIQARAGQATQVVVYDVATREALTELTGRLAARAQPTLETVEEARAKLWARMRPALESAWPSETAPLLAYRLIVEPESPTLFLQIAYLGEEDLGELGREALKKAVRERAGSPAVEISFERVSPKHNLLFGSGSAVLSSRNRHILENLAQVLRRFPQTGCEIGVAGRERKALDRLDQRRAHMIQEYLVQEQKIAAERVRTQPIVGKRNTIVLEILPPAKP